MLNTKYLLEYKSKFLVSTLAYLLGNLRIELIILFNKETYYASFRSGGSCQSVTELCVWWGTGEAIGDQDICVSIKMLPDTESAKIHVAYVFTLPSESLAGKLGLSVPALGENVLLFGCMMMMMMLTTMMVFFFFFLSVKNPCGQNMISGDRAAGHT